ncbi:MAG TPA: hypothetical protein VET65_08780 [Candidatus Limnocylindrales bacterium]|nr:hypothetical protein [Candidatus Limnocylindrales bacterium]
MGKTRRVAERLIVERANRCRRLAEELRTMAGRLEAYEAALDRSRPLADEARDLRALAEQVETLR